LSVTLKLITCPILIIKAVHHTNTTTSNNTRHISSPILYLRLVAGQNPVVGSCEHGCEYSDTTKEGGFNVLPTSYWLLNVGSIYVTT